ncbi:MAG TPA: 2-C-methyl-D-erythritol 4-phosphate cytidylyltransferase [Armatimonadetes bacterium]|nr:2-C-methyl-D-erythritol 4-phosphate cytidylyltransferase [Armatimonadota bacterium]
MSGVAGFVSAIIPAAGRGERAGGKANKLFYPLAGVPLLVHTLRACERATLVDEIVLVMRPEDQAQVTSWPARYNWRKTLRFAPGGETRQESVWRGLCAVDERCAIVVVHDGARPLVSPELLDRAVREAAQHGSAVAAIPVVDTIKRSPDGTMVAETLPREQLWAVQTPQAFPRTCLQAAHERALADGFVGTDEASLLEYSGETVRLIPGDRRNLKVTTPEDFVIAEAWLRTGGETPGPGEAGGEWRIGLGYDVHRLVEGRPLWLGGVLIPSDKGLLGHSDADALLHALCDALLGAIGAGDIGHHFPDTDPQYKDIASLRLLERVVTLVEAKGYRVHNVDATILAERPRLAPYLEQMRTRIAAVLHCSPEQVNLKATTHEGLGPIGAGEGIAAHAVACVTNK